jgi:hypothetical protein
MKKKITIRHCLYFDPKVSEQLKALTAEPGTTKSDIVNTAVVAFLKQRGASHIETQFKPRLDRMGQQIGAVERDLQILLESLGLYIRYQLTVAATVPPSQLASIKAAGNDRFQSFIDQVSRRIAKGTTFGGEVVERAQAERDSKTARGP